MQEFQALFLRDPCLCKQANCAACPSQSCPQNCWTCYPKFGSGSGEVLMFLPVWKETAGKERTGKEKAAVKLQLGLTFEVLRNLHKGDVTNAPKSGDFSLGAHSERGPKLTLCVQSSLVWLSFIICQQLNKTCTQVQLMSKQKYSVVPQALS